MNDLFDSVIHHIEGTETIWAERHTPQGVERITRRTFGPDRWIERAALGRLSALDFLATILFSVRDTFNLDSERRIVENWAAELTKAVNSGEVVARDSVTLLPLQAAPDGWDWLLSLADADKFLADRGMGWTCGVVIDHLLSETRNAGEEWFDANGKLVSQMWIQGYGPGSNVSTKQPEGTPIRDNNANSSSAPTKWGCGLKQVAFECAVTLSQEGKTLTASSLDACMRADNRVTVSGDTLQYSRTDASLKRGEDEVKTSTLANWVTALKKVITQNP